MMAEDEQTLARPFQVRDATTRRTGRGRRHEAEPRPGQTFQVREAVTLGPETGDRGPETVFQVRAAVTMTLPPPHWAHLVKSKEAEDDDPAR